jgi:hypothetical protein
MRGDEPQTEIFVSCSPRGLIAAPITHRVDACSHSTARSRDAGRGRRSAPPSAIACARAAKLIVAAQAWPQAGRVVVWAQYEGTIAVEPPVLPVRQRRQPPIERVRRSWIHYVPKHGVGRQAAATWSAAPTALESGKPRHRQGTGATRWPCSNLRRGHHHGSQRRCLAVRAVGVVNCSSGVYRQIGVRAPTSASRTELERNLETSS